MFDYLKSLFLTTGIHKVGLVVTMASQIIQTFEREFAQDQNAKIAALDTLQSILLNHKNDLSNASPTPSPSGTTQETKS